MARVYARGMSNTDCVDRWHDGYTEVCRKHPELVAAFESSRGRLALLLRDTLVPIDAEAEDWARSTRSAAGRVIRDLRAAGVTAPIVLLQHRSLKETAHVLASWTCRYDGDPARRRALARVANRGTADMDYISTARRTSPALAAPDAGPLTQTDSRTQERLVQWYGDMTQSWAGARPPPRAGHSSSSPMGGSPSTCSQRACSPGTS